MMRKRSTQLILFLGAVILLGLFKTMTDAATIDRDDPEALLKQATAELLALSTTFRDTSKQDRQPYYAQVSAILDQVIDKDYFARGVMATYASARLYRSLQTDTERDAFKARVHRFANVFQEVLIEKYADALLVFNAERIDIENITSGTSSNDNASLLQTISNKANPNITYKVQYSLRRQKDGTWLINNVMIEGFNLGATYREQFAEAVEKNHGDVDYVVDHWKEFMSQQTVVETKSND